jgi:hypothetical protein
MLREMLYRLNDDNESVLKANHEALASLSNKVPAEELVKHVEFMKGLIASMVSDARRRKGGVGDGEFFLPGFNMAKGMLRFERCTNAYRTQVDENIAKKKDPTCIVGIILRLVLLIGFSDFSLTLGKFLFKYTYSLTIFCHLSF